MVRLTRMKEYGQFHSQYSITLGLFCVLLYLYGFFPIKKSSSIVTSEDDLPAYLKGVKFIREKVYNVSNTKTILMVIDGLRVDFVTQENMPYTVGVMGEGEGCQLTARVAAPTVTLPRIKAIVTGSVSGFIDVVLNLGTAELTADNIVQQFTRTRRAVFYGDDTWLKLFPRHFIRSEGTSSFFVNDYTEVDDNVTRHLDAELKRSDWDLMILHYLGLDHIGHIAGPKSPLVQPKLREMDHIIRRLHTYLLKQDRGILVVCGDHGMKDSGSHGGVSLPEVLVPVAVLGIPCLKYTQQEILQVDLAATLSVLWSSPIPADNVGAVTLELLTHLTPSQRLYALLHNAHQLSSNFLRNGGSTTHETYQKYEEAKAKHLNWLVGEGQVTHEEVERLYEKSLVQMSRFLSETLANYNMPIMCSAIAILFQVSCLMGLRLLGDGYSDKRTLTVRIVIVFGLALLVISLLSPSQTLFASGLFFTVNSFLIYRQLQHVSNLSKAPRMFRRSFSWNEMVFLLGTVLFCISLFSSSLIEEEHQLWYFLWATVMTLHLKEKPVQWLAMMIVHRFLRRLNSTGDKWAHLPDTSDWLVQADHRPVLSAVCGASLLCVVACCVKLHPSRSSLLLYVCCAFLIYQYKAAIQQVHSFIPLWDTNGVTEARACWCVLAAALLLGRSLRSLLATWMLALCLLLRSYNTPLVPALFVVVRTAFTSNSSPVLPLWIGYVFYFYQGNSNSLASVDLAAGYVGLSEYNVSLVAVLLFVHTYGMPVLAYLLHIHHIVEKTRKWKMKVEACTEVMVFVQLLHVFTCLVVVTLQRYHLFVWTVFSPKLLYVAAQTFVCFMTVSITNISICYVKSREQLFHV